VGRDRTAFTEEPTGCPACRRSTRDQRHLACSEERGLTPGNVSDIRVADDLIEAAGPVRRLIADRGYDANRLRHTLRATGTIPIIPGRRSRKRPIRHDERRYRDRWRIEAAFCRLKDFRRVATRYDKLAINFLSAVVLAAIIAFWV